MRRAFTIASIAACLAWAPACSCESPGSVPDAAVVDDAEASSRDDAGPPEPMPRTTYDTCEEPLHPCESAIDRCAIFDVTELGEERTVSACSPPCVTDADCPTVEEVPGVACLPIGRDGTGVCIVRCTMPTHCLAFQSCVREDDERSWCFPS